MPEPTNDPSKDSPLRSVPVELRLGARRIIKHKIGNQDFGDWLRDFVAEGGILENISSYAELEAAECWHKLIENHAGILGDKIQRRLLPNELVEFDIHREGIKDRLKMLFHSLNLSKLDYSPEMKKNIELFTELTHLIDLHQVCQGIADLLVNPDNRDKGLIHVLEQLTMQSQPMPPLSSADVNDWWIPMYNFSTLLEHSCCMDRPKHQPEIVEKDWVKLLPTPENTASKTNRLPNLLPTELMQCYNTLAQAITRISRGANKA